MTMENDRALTNDSVPEPAGPGVAETAPKRRRGRQPSDDPVSLGLRKLWQHVETEPVPREFLDLLDAIDAARAQSRPVDRWEDEGGSPPPAPS
jgi:hypothetical protein